MAKTIVGLDFGHGVVRAAEVVPARGDKKAVLKRYHEVGVPTDAIKEGVVADQPAIVSALKWLWKVGGFSTTRVVIGMGSQQVLIRELVVPSMPIKHVRESLPYRVQDLLPLPVQDAVLDFYPVEEFEQDGTAQLRGLLVAATRESVLINASAVEAAGLRTLDVDLIPFAVARHECMDRAEGTRILVHLGAVSTSIIVAEEGVPQFIRMLPTGGADLTATIGERLEVGPQRAEDLKRRIGLTADPADAEEAVVAGICRENVRDLIQAVRTTISFFQNAHPEEIVNTVVLSGGGGQLRGLDAAIASAVDLRVERTRNEQHIALAGSVDESSLIAAGAGPTVALGLTIGRSV